VNLRLPPTHAGLLDRPLHAVLTTEMPDARLQSTVVWFDRDGDHLLVNTMREFRKARNLRERPRATLLVQEPGDGRWIEVRARVSLEESGAREHLDEIARAYTGTAPYFGAVVPAELAEREHPVICRLLPTAVTVGPASIPAPRRRSTARIPAPRGCGEEPPIPASHRELLERPLLAALSTRFRDGAQTNPTWFELDANDVLVNTTLERAKGRNLLRDPRATVLVVSPEDSGRWIEIRGDVDLELAGAVEQLDRLTRLYTTQPAFYGHVYAAERRALETRVVARIHPRRITLDAIH
jgi:PPOX class probable F420-dependent enzyme